TIDATGFYRDQDNGAPPLGLGGFVTAVTHGRTFGAELLIRRPLTRRLYGWLAYTWMHSQLRWEPLAGSPGGSRPGDVDQRHNLTIVASYKLPGGWQIGGRFRLVSGQPYTPIIGSVEYEGGFAAIRGLPNAARFPPFHQLDLRVDRR